jgi:protein-S-isoprenylcysteine O-methyltransferase Ste14
MREVLIYVIQLVIPFALSFAVTNYLQGTSRRLLEDLCGTKDRAEYWVRITAVLTIAVPVLLVLMFGSVPTEMCFAGGSGCVAGIIKQAVCLSLGGIILAILVVASRIHQQLPPSPSSRDFHGSQS